MGALARVVRRLRSDLGPSEGLLASVLGRERGGRRRVAIVATDRRLLLATLRPEPVTELGYAGLEAGLTVEDGRARITLLADGTAHQVDRVGDVGSARLLVDQIRQRTDPRERPEVPPRVRIVPSGPDGRQPGEAS